jgi:hypothetical protein
MLSGWVRMRNGWISTVREACREKLLTAKIAKKWREGRKEAGLRSLVSGVRLWDEGLRFLIEFSRMLQLFTL